MSDAGKSAYQFGPFRLDPVESGEDPAGQADVVPLRPVGGPSPAGG